MTSRQIETPETEAEYLEWSARWEAAQAREGRAPMAALAVGILGGIAVHTLLVRHGVPPRPWPNAISAAMMLGGVVLCLWLKLRNDARSTMPLRVCSACEQIIVRPRAVVAHGGRCSCGAQIYTPAG